MQTELKHDNETNISNAKLNQIVKIPNQKGQSNKKFLSPMAIPDTLKADTHKKGKVLRFFTNKSVAPSPL